MDRFCSYRGSVWISDHFKPNCDNKWLTTKNGNISDIGGKTYYVDDDDITKKRKKLNVNKIVTCLYGELFAKHYLNQYKTTAHLSYFYWMHDIPRYVIWSAQKNHKNHYNKLKKMTKVQKVNLVLPERFKLLDLTPLLDGGKTTQFNISCGFTHTTHVVGWKTVFLLYVIFKMGRVSEYEGGVWHSDQELSDVGLDIQY